MQRVFDIEYGVNMVKYCFILSSKFLVFAVMSMACFALWQKRIVAQSWPDFDLSKSGFHVCVCVVQKSTRGSFWRVTL